jgi:exodeoxyribonuclease V beta subunit
LGELVVKPFDLLACPLMGRTLVEASAGTGKTYAIANLFVRLLLEQQLSVSQILVVTFTEAATLELRDRIRSRLRDALAAFEQREPSAAQPELRRLAERSSDRARDAERLRLALYNADEAAIFTIHGFCHRVLQDRAFDTGVAFGAELVTDLLPLRDEIVFDFFHRELAEATAPHARLLLRSGLTPAGCRTLVDRVLRHPELVIEPASVPGRAAPDWYERFHDAFHALARVWNAPQVERALVAGGISEAKARPRLRELQSYVDRQPPELPEGFDKLRYFLPPELPPKAPPHPVFAACAALSEAVDAFAGVKNSELLRFRRRLVDCVRQELAERKRSRGILSFDDLLMLLERALVGAGGAELGRSLRARYPAALIDEFQDTDPLQYRIFERIYGSAEPAPDTSLFLIGDPKQAIYAFRGADVFAYLAAARAPSVSRYTMDVCFRSDPGLVRSVARLFEGLEHPFLLDIELPEVRAARESGGVASASGGVSPALEVLFLRRQGRETGKNITMGTLRPLVPRLVAAEVSALLARGLAIGGQPVTPGDVAVLTRTNQQAIDVQRALAKLRIPAVVLGDASVFETVEARELRRLLAAVVEPTDGRALRAALTTELLGVTASELAELEQDAAAWDGWVSDFRSWQRLWADKGFVQMFHTLLGARDIRQRLLSRPDGERRLTNVLHLMELLHQAAAAGDLGPAGLLHFLNLEIAGAQAVRTRPEAAQIRLESDERAVKVTTVHKSKGLEYPIVFLPYLWNGSTLRDEEEKFPVFHGEDGRLTLDLDPDSLLRHAHIEQARFEQLAESVRLLYVALTRARHQCVLLWCAGYCYDASALGYALFGARGPSPKAPDVDAIRARLSHLGDDAMLARLAELASASSGEIAIAEVDRNPLGAVYTPHDAARPALGCRTLERPIAVFHRTASFSALASASGTLVQALPLEEGRDHDELGTEVELLAELDPEARGAPLALAEFPRGARAGNFFHELFEALDFRDGAALEPLVTERLGVYGYAAELAPAVCGAMRDVLRTPLDRSGLTLASLDRSRRLDELEFTFPVAGPGAGPLTQRALSEVFAAHPSEELPAEYAERIAKLRFLPLEGFMKGYIDLVFEHAGRYYVADYKTNHLGDRIDAYARARLGAAMAHGHYFLQYHLYALALHRYLERRRPGYTYEHHFGGVYYLFIKGMSPATGSECGVFFERPPLARLAALSSLFASPPLPLPLGLPEGVP